MATAADDRNMLTEITPSELLVCTVDDADLLMERVVASAARTVAWVMAHDGQPLDLLRLIKFETVGFHPVEGRALRPDRAGQPDLDLRRGPRCRSAATAYIPRQAVFVSLPEPMRLSRSTS